MPRIHTAKSWAAFYDAFADGRKTHDLRINDRHYAVGDVVVLERYDPFGGCYTGEAIAMRVTYITSERTPCAFSSAVLQKGYCILSLRRTEMPEAYDTADKREAERSLT